MVSIFGKFNKGRREAKAQLKNKTEERLHGHEAVVVEEPYKHIPTHAAFDALNGTPWNWTTDDRSKIKEHHKRRSQTVIVSRNASSMQMQGAHMTRNSSYSTCGLHRPMSWNDSGYFPTDAPAQKRFQLGRGQSTLSMSGSMHQYTDSIAGPSRLASNAQSEGKLPPRFVLSYENQPRPNVGDNMANKYTEASPFHSSGNSSRSDSSEPIEFPNSKPQGTTFVPVNVFDSLHTSTTRKLGEAPQRSGPPVEVKTPAAVVTVKKPSKRTRWSIMRKKTS